MLGSAVISRKVLLINIIAFQLLWWLCVLSRNGLESWLALQIVMLYCMWHVCLIERPLALLPISVCALLGVVSDQLLYTLQFLDFPGYRSAWIPLWMIALWFAFATTLNISLRWLQGRWRLAALLGSMLAPLTYWGAQGLGAITFPDRIAGLLAVGLSWGILLPLMTWIRQQY